MEKSVTEPKKDILEEEYKGTGRAISALGLGALETKIGILAGIGLGAVAGLVAPETINKASASSLQWAKNLSASQKDIPGILPWCKRMVAGTVSGVFKFGDVLAVGTLGHFTASSKDLKSQQEILTQHKKTAILQKFSGFGSRALAMFTAGGVLALAGLMVSIVTGTVRGVAHATEGKNQFTNAQKEIKALRGEKDALTAELETASKEVAQLKAERIKLVAENEALPKPTVSHAQHAEMLESQHPHKKHH